jgi:hypothetical protein
VSHTAEGLEAARSGRKPRRGPRLRPARFEDHEQIDRLGSRYGLKPKSYEEWSHLWLGNPVYQDVQDRWSIGWVLEDENARIVGSMGNIPVTYELDGRTLLAASGHAWVTEPEYRSAALLLLDRVVSQQGVDLFVNTTNSAASTPGVDALQCIRVPAGLWDQSAFWITGYRGFLRSYVALKHPSLANPLSYPLAAAVFVKDRLMRKTWRANDAQIRVCPAFDERFDEFWVALKRRQPGMLLAVRTREVLEWHFKSLLTSNRLWIAGVADGERLAAYAIFDRSDKPALGLKRVRLVDFQSLDGGPALLPPLLAWALGRCRDEGIHVLEYFGRWLEEGEVVGTIAPYRRRLPTWIFLYRAHDPALAQRLQDRRAWAPTLYDGDASLVR